MNERSFTRICSTRAFHSSIRSELLLVADACMSAPFASWPDRSTSSSPFRRTTVHARSANDSLKKRPPRVNRQIPSRYPRTSDSVMVILPPSCNNVTQFAGASHGIRALFIYTDRPSGKTYLLYKSPCTTTFPYVIRDKTEFIPVIPPGEIVKFLAPQRSTSNNSYPR